MKTRYVIQYINAGDWIDDGDSIYTELKAAIKEAKRLTKYWDAKHRVIRRTEKVMYR